ncbi:MAG: glycoside hydrolase family 10 protein, partial [Limisphaerales bacterium]
SKPADRSTSQALPIWKSAIRQVWKPAILFVTVLVLSGCISKPLPTPPTVSREFRAMWICTVNNGDWPSKRTLTTDEQKRELTDMLDRAAELKFNAVVFQVRPCCDAIYDSPIEPWSQYLTGKIGQAPEPYYDPLTFAIEESHKRGLELHAWFNPYRAGIGKLTNDVPAKHVTKAHPELVHVYGKHLWLDPGEPATREYSLSVIKDVVHRYDVDGIHFDDYFYPYREKTNKDDKVTIPFPDDLSWKKYQDSGGTLKRDDWRRDNVNQFVKQVGAAIKADKPWVKFGISPFGIWQPGFPPQIKGLNSHEILYCDSRMWLSNALVDYLNPQLYWRIDKKEQSFPVLLKWWTEQNPQGRHLWPGMSVRGDATELTNQIAVTRSQPGSTGHVIFHALNITKSTNGVDTALAETYAAPALIPASPWLSTNTPIATKLSVKRKRNELKLAWKPLDDARWWLVQQKLGSNWTTEILPGSETNYVIKATNSAALPEHVYISAVNRLGNIGDYVAK